MLLSLLLLSLLCLILLPSAGSFPLLATSPRPPSPLRAVDPPLVDLAAPLFDESLSKALASSLSASKASVAQVSLLMWTRTVLNYQYTTGLPFLESLNTLYSAGGLRRLYSGLPFALIQVPTSRFCDVLSNDLALLLFPPDLPLPLKSFAGSSLAACCRLVLTPVDTVKTT
jgi:hypothetical protein